MMPVIYLLQRSLSHLEDAGNTVRITFFDFSSAFNTIHPSLLRVKLERAGASDQLAAWVITNYLTDRPSFSLDLTSERVRNVQVTWVFI
ncbi:hypothetical protein L3Q82_024359 [Scortum barcoo]|uniref:Uncharacterized protein n=1 Tax=Scortum barcoo TaxID=214431 RepID=A0ACB8WVS4_9TELE|nr:hypothetical protein L3Q82_024359 [Scortum barcoo]